MAENYDPVPDLAEMFTRVLLGGRDGADAADRIAERLGLGEDDSPETVAGELRKALGLKACRCGITPGAPSEVIPPACPVHGIPCEHCGGTESCKENCNG